MAGKIGCSLQYTHIWFLYGAAFTKHLWSWYSVCSFIIIFIGDGVNCSVDAISSSPFPFSHPHISYSVKPHTSSYRVLLRVIWAVTSKALRRSHYCTQSEVGVAFPTFCYIVSGDQNNVSGGKSRLSTTQQNTVEQYICYNEYFLLLVARTTLIVRQK